MGKKSKKSGGEKEQRKEFVLKVAMHCHCNGCIDKIRAAVKDITLHPGIDSWDQSALESKGELRLLASADPEKLRHRLHKATRKNVDLVFPKDKQDANARGGGNKAANDAAAAAAAQALLLNTLQQQGQYPWPTNQNQLQLQLLPGAGGGWNAQSPYPWAVQQPDPYAAYSAAAGGAWGAYAYPPSQSGAWHGHGY